MITRELKLTNVTQASPAQGGAITLDLQEALGSWKGLCDRAVEGIAAHDLDVVDEALASREALRPRIAELVARLRSEGAPLREAAGTIVRLQQSAAEADARLVSVLEGEQFRLRREIDGLGRPSAPAAAYGRATETSRHRLDIVR